MILFVDACVREKSRTRHIAKSLIERLGDDVETVFLPKENIPKLDEKRLQWRMNCSKEHNFDDSYFDYAKAFAEADTIVIAAPFWDMSFPAILKEYIEAVCVGGITFRYSETGIPIGLCKAKKLYYVVTAGGTIFNSDHGFGYIKNLSQMMFGIHECKMISAEKLDIAGSDSERIVRQCIAGLDEIID